RWRSTGARRAPRAASRSGRSPAATTPGLSKLSQDPEVPLPERADVGEVVLQLGDALDPAAEGETAPLAGVDADVLEHAWVDHPGAAHLDPARVTAGKAAGPPPQPPHTL